MAISCVYCGGSHADATDVRACWQRTESAPTSVTGATVAVAPTRRAVAEGFGPAPALLGRNVVIRPDQQSPAGCSGAQRLPVTARDLAHPEQAIAELRRSALARLPLMIELESDVAQALAAPETTSAPPHELGPRFEFHRSTLHHLVVSNSVDATEADALHWPLLDRAIDLGATIVTDGRGDIELPDGSRAWLDGGPIRFTAPIDGVPVLHRIAVEHGSLTPFRSNDTSADLAPDQLAAVVHDGGAARIIAPAGSGKTRVLTERARHLLRQWCLPAGPVSLVAFNKRAQEEMRERTTDLRGLQVRTLNAIALAIVNGSAPFAAQPRQLQTIDEPEVRRIIGKLVKFPRKRNADPVATWIEALSLARLGLRPPDQVEQMYDGEVDGFAEVLPRYRRELERSNALDFDEQVQRAIEVLLTDPGARAAAQRACRIMLVDEFQDLTPAHLLLVRLLAGPDGAVFGVGDDDQTIYGYNGAEPEWLIGFGALFPGAGEHPLEVNYRCPANVVAAADMLLRHNSRRVQKQIRPAKHAEGLTVELGDTPVATTVRLVRESVDAGTSTSDIAVLTRVNSLLVPVQVALAQLSIPTTGGVGREFAERTAVRAALAWLRLANADGSLDGGDLTEALRRPSRPMHPNIANWVAEQRSIDGLRRLAARITTERDAQRVDEFTDDIERLQRMARTRGTTGSLLGALRDSMGLASSIATLDAHRRGMNRTAQNDDLTAIAQLAELQPDPTLFEAWLRDALSRAWKPSGVTLATVHRVKGQEWPLVVVHHAAADQFPHRLADDVEEERRVFHVAITRASRRLHIVADTAPSPFIAELSNEPPKLPAAVPGRLAGPTVEPARKPFAGKPGHGLTREQAKLFDELRAVRRHLAAGKPAYIVFSDAVLHDIAVIRPATMADLARVKGIGPSKLDQYGAAILAVVESAAPESAAPESAG